MLCCYILSSSLFKAFLIGELIIDIYLEALMSSVFVHAKYVDPRDDLRQKNTQFLNSGWTGTNFDQCVQSGLVVVMYRSGV